MHDPELATLLPEIVGPDGRFGHRQHIHLAFLAVRRYGMPDAADRVCGWLRQVAAYERARHGWTEPDITPFPWPAGS